jgi:hypothetical protein
MKPDVFTLIRFHRSRNEGTGKIAVQILGENKKYQLQVPAHLLCERVRQRVSAESERTSASWQEQEKYCSAPAERGNEWTEEKIETRAKVPS